MKVRFLQSGGFAGAPRGCALDATTLEPEEAEELRRLVETSGVTETGTSVSPAARDRKRYEVTIDRGANAAGGATPDAERGAVRVVWDDASVPDEARPLLAFLKRRSRPGGLGDGGEGGNLPA